MLPSHLDVDNLVSLVHARYAKCGFKPSNEYQFTVLAAFVLSRARNSDTDSELDARHDFKVISLATGSKCLPKSRLSARGDTLHDSHAEVLARRGAVRWLYEEIQRCCANGNASEWIQRRESSGKYALDDGIALHMYISTIPCGDASTRLLASTQLIQDPNMAALKSTSSFAPLPPNAASRGRDNYSLLGVLRTKPGRADSPPTISMSCSDKIASWCVLGVQGALASEVMEPVYLGGLVIGLEDVPGEESVREMVMEDCERAVWGRLEGFEAPPGFTLTRPSISFTLREFIYSRAVIQARYPDKLVSNSSNESLCWFADSLLGSEVVINGARRGIGAARRSLEKYRPRLCKLSLFSLHAEVLKLILGTNISASTTYYEAKRAVKEYATARIALKGEGGPFAGWVVSGKEWESFTLGGTAMAESDAANTDEHSVEPDI